MELLRTGHWFKAWEEDDRRYLYWKAYAYKIMKQRPAVGDFYDSGKHNPEFYSCYSDVKFFTKKGHVELCVGVEGKHVLVQKRVFGNEPGKEFTSEKNYRYYFKSYDEFMKRMVNRWRSFVDLNKKKRAARVLWKYLDRYTYSPYNQGRMFKKLLNKLENNEI